MVAAKKFATHEDLFDLDPRLADRLAQLGQIAAGIDERALVGFGAPQQSAVLLKGGDGHDRGAKRRVRIFVAR